MPADKEGAWSRYTRADLEKLKTFDRPRVLASLGSFDERSLDKTAFVVAAANFLATERIAGLPAALQDRDAMAIERVLGAHATGLEVLPAAPATGTDMDTAAEALQHRFTFYGETHQLPAEINWDENPGTAHWGHDLNRFSYLAPLVNAFESTRESRFARKAIDLMLDWVAQCPIERCFAGTPYVFGSYLNNAIHCMAWARTLQRLLPTGLVAPVEFLRLVKSLHEQLAYLEIVTAGHAGNWPTIGCQGILATLAALPFLAAEDRMAQYSIAALDQQLEEQVLPDGVQDELTPHYHSCVVGNILTAASSARTLDRCLRDRTLTTLGKMIHYQAQTIVPDGSAQVAFNDSDPAAVPHITGQLEALGLGTLVPALEDLGPESFPYAGVALLRQRATQGDLFLAFDGGPFGRSHQHEDKLGFCLFAYGHNFIVDPGRHLYDFSEVSYLPYLRSSRAHSTVLVDGLGQHSRGRPDTWIATEETPLIFAVSGGEVRAAAAYDLGYGEDNAIDVVHRREIVLVRDRFWVLFDRLEGEGTHRIEWRFQYAPGSVHLAGARLETAFDDANLLLEATGSWDDVRLECGREDPRGGWYSPAYGRLEKAPALALEIEAALPLTYAVLLFPYRGRTAPAIAFSFDGHMATIEDGEGRIEVSAT